MNALEPLYSVPWTVRRPPFWALFFVCLASNVTAHLCGDSAKQLDPGLYLYTITADVEESQPSLYEVIDDGDTNVVVIESPYSFSSYNVGQFILRAINPGSTVLQLRWTYAPNNASADCFVTINVQSSQRIHTAANYGYSQFALDPINTYTGELIRQEEPDLNLGGPLPVYFARYYASGLHRDSVLSEPLGLNWSHNFNARLLRAGDRADVITARGQRIGFETSGSGWQLSGTYAVPYQLVEQGAEYVFGDPCARRLQRFDATGRLIQIADRAGNALTLTYAGEVLDEVTDGLGRTLSFQYEGFQKLSSVSDGTRTVGFGYLGGVLTQFTDARGKTTQYNYDFFNPIQGLLSSEVLPLGQVPYAMEWDPEGRVARQILAGAGHYDFHYDGSTTQVTNPAGEVTMFVHNTDGALASLTDGMGGVLTQQFNSSGQRTGLTDRDGRQLSLTFHAPSGLPASLQHPDGRTFSVDYVARTHASGIMFYHVSKISYDDGKTDQYSRDAVGNVTNWVDRAGRSVTLGYNTNGQPTHAMDPLGRTLFASYNEDRTLATYGFPAGSGFETTFGHDALKRKTSVNRPDGTSLTFQYDEQDHITRIKDERNHFRHYVYNDNGWLAQSVDAAGRTNQLTYGNRGQLTGLVDPLGKTLGFDYHFSGRLSAVINRLGVTARYDYNPANRLEAITNAAGGTHVYTRDGEGLLTAITDPLGAITGFEKLADGNTLRITSPLTNTYSAGYSHYGSLTSLTNPMGGVTLVTRDATDLILGRQVGGAASALYSREPTGLLDGLIDGIGGAWEYPRGLVGEVTMACDPLERAIHYTNDVRGRVIGMSFPGGLGTLSLSYSALDEITRLDYSDGTDLRFTNNAVGELTGANGISLAYDAAGRMTNCNGLAIGWDATDRMTLLLFQPGRAIAFSYDERGLLTNITDWAGGGLALEYDALGRPTVVRRANGVHTTNTWNAEGMLTHIQDGTLADITLVRNANGDVRQAIRNLPVASILGADSRSWTHDIASQISGHTYDALGRFLTDGMRVCSWDLASRLTHIVSGGTDIASTYDALNYRLTRTQNGTQAKCVWNYAVPLPSMCVVRMGGNDVRYFVHTPLGELLYSIEAGSNARRYYHFDEMGNTTFLTDDSGSIVAAYAYSPYGELLASTGTVANPFTWQGRNGAFQEADTGLYYLRARFYDSRTGRFLSKDPVHSMDPLRVNPYQYALNNPLRYMDPSGLDASSSYPDWRAGTFTDGLARFDNPLELRAHPGVKYGSRLEVGFRDTVLDLSAKTAEFNPLTLSALQFDANFALSYTVTEDREPKIRRLERELMELGQSLPPQRRMSLGGGWNALNPAWGTVGAYFGAVVDQFTQPPDFSANHTGSGLETLLDPEARLDQLQRELERCRRGPSPPLDVSNVDLNFRYQLGGGVSYNDDPLRVGVSLKF